MTTYVISSSVVSSGLTISSSDRLNVYGVANRTALNGGYLDIYSGGFTSGTTVSSGGTEYVQAGGTAHSTTVSSGGTEVVSGGTTQYSIVNNGGTEVVSGGITSGTTVNSGGIEDVKYSGIAEHTTVNSGGTLTVETGGSATSTVHASVIKSFDTAAVTNGGMVSGLTLHPGATIDLGGVIADAVSVSKDGSNRLVSTNNNGAVVNSISLGSDHSGLIFTTESDGAGGTNIHVFPNAPLSALQLAQSGIGLQAADQFIADNIGNPQKLFATAAAFGLTPSRLSEMTGYSIGEISQYFASNGLDPNALNLTYRAQAHPEATLVGVDGHPSSVNFT